MQLTGISPLSLLARICFGIVNAVILLALYISHASCSFWGITVPGVAVLSEIACAVGLVTCALLLIVRWNGLMTRWIFVGFLTLWNQACLILFLVILIPVHIHT